MKITKLLTSITLAAVCTLVFNTGAFAKLPGLDLDSGTPLYQNASDTDTTVNASLGSSPTGFEMPSVDKNGNPLTVPTRDGYIFTGYYSTRSGGTQYYSAGMDSVHARDTRVNMGLYAHWVPVNIASNESDAACDNDTVAATSGDTSFDAIWTPNTINLKYMANGSEFESKTCLYGQNVNIPITTPTRTGYNFTGWVVHSDE